MAELNGNSLISHNILRLTKYIKNIHITFVGNIVDMNVKNRFDDFLKDNDIRNYVTVTGFIEDTMPYYYGSDLLICSSFVEGLPISILEAMSVGLPIISTNVGGVDEQIDHGINGFLIETNNPLDLSNKIQYFIRRFSPRSCYCFPFWTFYSFNFIKSTTPYYC